MVAVEGQNRYLTFDLLKSILSQQEVFLQFVTLILSLCLHFMSVYFDPFLISSLPAV